MYSSSPALLSPPIASNRARAAARSSPRVLSRGSFVVRLFVRMHVNLNNLGALGPVREAFSVSL